MLSRRRRTSRRSYIPRPLKKYSVEHTSLNRSILMTSPFTQSTFAVDIIPQLATYGVRKVKNINLTITLSPVPCPILWAVVYLPEGLGTADSSGILYAKLNNPGSDMTSVYEPNQNVIMSGILPASPNTATTPVVLRKSTRLARNLNSGDRVQLAFNLGAPQFSDITSYTLNFSALTSFAVAFS